MNDEQSKAEFEARIQRLATGKDGSDEAGILALILIELRKSKRSWFNRIFRGGR